MALTLVNTSYLHGAFAPGGVTGYDVLVHSWAGSGATIAAGTSLFQIGENDTPVTASSIRLTVGSTNRCRAIVLLDDGTTTYSADNTNATAWTNNQWRSAAGHFRPLSRLSYLDTVAGTANTQNASSMAAWTADRIGSLLDTTGSGNTVTSQCERTIWDISLLSDTQVQDLVNELGTLVGGLIPHALNVNEAVVQGTYSQTGTTVTVTATDHGLEAGDEVGITFQTGNGVDATITVLAGGLTANAFTYTAGGSQSTSGNCTVDRIWKGKCRSYVTLTNRDAASRTNVIDPTEVYAEGGTQWSDTRIVAQPVVDDYIGWNVTISDVSPNPLIDGSNFTITGTGFSPLGDDPVVTINNVAQAVVSSTDTEITCTADVGALLYGETYNIQITNAFNLTNDESIEVTFEPASGEAYTTITETPAVDNDPPIRISGSPDITADPPSQVHYKTLRGDVDGTPTAEPITKASVKIDGAVSFNSTVALDADLQARINNNDGEGWSAFATQTFSDVGADEPVLVGDGTFDALLLTYADGTIDISTQVSTPVATWTWTDEGTNLPAWAVLDPDTGIITYTDAVYGYYDGITIRATGTLQHVDITLVIDVTPGTNLTALNWMQAIVYNSNVGGANQGWMDFLASQGLDEGTFNDRMKLWLETLGYAGSLSDMWAEWKEDNGITG